MRPASGVPDEHCDDCSPDLRRGAKNASQPGMDPLPRIPSPTAVRIREFCHRVLPVLIFIAAVAVAAQLWGRIGSGRLLTGVGEGPRTSVVSPHPASIVRFLVEPYAQVRQGDPIAVLQPYNPGMQVDLLRSRLDLARIASTPSPAQENAIPLERLRVEVLRTQSELAISKVRLEFAERELARNEPLFRDRLVSADIYELSRSTRDQYRAEVEVKTKAFEALEARLAQFEEDAAGSQSAPVDPGLMASLESAQSDVVTNWNEITLTAPIDGTVGAFLRQAGEFLIEGEPLVTVHSDHATHIVAYLRQPFGFEPRPGLPVTVSRRVNQRLRLPSQVLHVGPQFEPITNVLALVRDGMLIDSGLPLIVALPPGLHLRPGEIVDIQVRPRGAPDPRSLAQSVNTP